MLGGAIVAVTLIEATSRAFGLPETGRICMPSTGRARGAV
jgi:hypothetical protein